MKIAISADHAGFQLKEFLKHHLEKAGYQFVDFGTDDDKPIDCPDITKKAADAVAMKQCARAIVLCGSGVGACIVANKVNGIRAAICHDCYSAHQGVEHDDMNVLVMGARIIGPSLALEIAETFLAAQFSNEERHIRRLNKILALENG